MKKECKIILKIEAKENSVLMYISNESDSPDEVKNFVNGIANWTKKEILKNNRQMTRLIKKFHSEIPFIVSGDCDEEVKRHKIIWELKYQKRIDKITKYWETKYKKLIEKRKDEITMK